MKNPLNQTRKGARGSVALMIRIRRYCSVRPQGFVFENDINEQHIQEVDDDKNSDTGPVFSWTPSAVLAPLCPGGSASISASVCGLFAEGNSVPFIARYRRPQTGGMTPDDLRNE